MYDGDRLSKKEISILPKQCKNLIIDVGGDCEYQSNFSHPEDSAISTTVDLT